MATVKKGILTHAREWWVHLRPYGKRDFWHRERRAAERVIKDRVGEFEHIAEIDREIDFVTGNDYETLRHRRMD